MLPVIEIIRLEETQQGTIGVLKINKTAFCCTLEPWDWENKESESSIPVQQYIGKRITSPKFGVTFEITNVPGRTHILFHKGNFVGDTTGCVIVGESFGKLGAQRAVKNSGRTFDRFMEFLKDHDTIHITISEVY